MTVSHSERHINPIDGAEMTWIPAGEFLMGSVDEDFAAFLAQNPAWNARWFAHEKPQRTVELPGYWIYTLPVTVAQFIAFSEATGWRMPPEPAWGWIEDHPMVNVSWEDANQYANWAHAALPNEAQWEKAARGTDARLWPWGNEDDMARSINASNANSTRPVGTLPAGDSPFGVKDMAGNVWEWCIAAAAGEYDRPTPSGYQRRPVPPPGNRVLRGGSWQCAFSAHVRCAYRSFDCDQHKGRGPYRRPTTGFRCVVLGA